MVEKITKSINKYYCKKRIIVWGLMVSLIVMLVTMLIAVFFGCDICGFIALVSYIILLLFVIMAMLFPVGTYNIVEELAKQDIMSLLDYIINLEGGFNKRFDCLTVVKTTAYRKYKSIKNWDTKDKEENAYNDAWKALFDYLDSIELIKIDIDNFKSYAQTLKDQVACRKIDENVLDQIKQVKRSNPDEPKKYRINWERLMYIVCTLALITIVVLKGVIINFRDDLDSNWLIKNFVQLGSDIVALIFAGFAISNTYMIVSDKTKK